LTDAAKGARIIGKIEHITVPEIASDNIN
jgi:hypothetical protein